MNMLRELKEGVKEALYFIGLALKALLFWRRKPPVTVLSELIRFVETRSKYVSQRTLFGYLKTRAGTRYTLLFEDETFARSINISKWEIYLASLADLSIHVAARVYDEGSGSVDLARELAQKVFSAVIEDEEIPAERPHGFGDASLEFEKRLIEVDWANAAEGEAIFKNSLNALIRWAPVADELKKYDIVPVKNSMRFEWKRVRDEMTQIFEFEAIRVDLNSL